MTQESKPLVQGHVPALDGLRGIAILLVLLVHLTPWKDPYHGLSEFLLSVADVGWVGVDLFFALSAFLITNILIDTRGNAHYFRDFYVRRALRIAPLYYVCITIECLILPHIFGVPLPSTRAALHQQWALWTYTANWVPDIYRGGWFSLGHMWSLSMEEQFYLLWAIAVALLPPRRLALVGSIIAALVITLQTSMLLSGTVYHAGPFEITPETICRFDGFLAGSLLAAGLRLWERAHTLRRFLWPAAILIGLPLFESIRRHLLSNAIETAPTRLIVWTKALAFPALALFFASIVGLSVAPEGRHWQRIISIRPLQFLGKYSYGIYVVHGALLPLFERLVSRASAFKIGGNPNRASLVYFVIGALISIAGALVTYHLIERPFLRLKRYFGGERTQARHLTAD